MSNIVVKVVSYKRPENNTCKLLSKTSFNWKVFVYKFDPYLQQYLEKYGGHVYILNFEKPSLPNKRQTVLDTSVGELYKYCVMLDDDIETIKDSNGNDKTITDVVNDLKSSILNTDYIAISTSYNLSNDKSDVKIEDYKNVCNNSIFNIDLYKKSNVRYNPESKCEDMEFTIELLLNGYKTGRLKDLIVHNVLQGGNTNDGLSYRFNKKNRFIEEGEYMSKRFEFMKEVFEYDENHFKMNTEKLLKYIKL